MYNCVVHFKIIVSRAKAFSTGLGGVTEMKGAL